MDHASLRRHARHQHGERIRGILREHGGRSDEAEDRLMIKRAMGEHDRQLHPGKHTRLKLADGGAAEGGASARRLDRGGRSGKAKGKGSHVNVIVAPGGGGQDRPVPVPVPAGGPPGLPPRPPMAPPAGPGMVPPGMPPAGLARPPMAAGMPPPGMMPPGMMPRRKGGRVRADGGRAEADEAHGKTTGMPHMTGGGHSGIGRLQKAKMKVSSAAAAGD